MRVPKPIQRSAPRGAFLLRRGRLAVLVSALVPALPCSAVAQAGPGATVSPDSVPAPHAVLQDSLPGAVAATALPGGGAVVLYPLPAQAIVAFRVAFLLSGAAGPPEALARIAQQLLRPEMERRAAQLGARVAFDRSATHAGFSIMGAADDGPELVAILRDGLARASWPARELQAAHLIALARAGEEAETVEPVLRRRLREALFPDMPARGDSVPARVTAATIQSFWSHTFRPERMRAVVVGPLTLAQAVDLLGSWPVPDQAPPDTGLAPPPRTRPGPPQPATGDTAAGPQVVFPWAAAGWRTDASPAVLAVAARLIDARLAAAAALRTHRAELWWSGGARALVLLGSSFPPPPDTSATRGPGRGARAPAFRSLALPRPAPMPGPAAVLRAAAADAIEHATPEEVAAARQAVARDLLFAARTPAGLALYLGEMYDRTADPLSGQKLLLQLDAVDAGSVAAVLQSLGEPLVQELPR